MMNLKQLWAALGFAWHYRRPIFATITEIDLIQRHYHSLATATDARDAQNIVADILNLRSINEIVAATETKVDDEWLARMKMFVDDFDIFNVAWKILHGDWSINVNPVRRNQPFFSFFK